MSLNETRRGRREPEETLSGGEVRDDGWVDALRRERLRRSVRNPGLAALMSFLLMGLGQIYAGHIDRGIILMMMHAGTIVGCYSLYTRGLLYETIAPHFGPAAIVAVVYVIGVVFILLWIYNIKDAYYRSLFSGLRDWFEVERILIPHLKDGGASHLLGAPVPPRARLTGPGSVRSPAVEEADEATVIEVARQEEVSPAAVQKQAGAADPKEAPRKKRKRSSDRPAAAMADALEEATGVARNWRFTVGVLVIFLLVGVWLFNRQKWHLEDLGPSPTLFSVSSDAATGTEAIARRVSGNRQLELRQAVALLETGSLTAAISAFEDVVRRPDAPPDAWKGLMRAYHRSEQQGAYEDAVARYLKAYPEDADEWVTLGKLQYDRRAYVDASRSMLKCLAKDPTHLRGNYMMGVIYRELGLAEDAVPHLRKAQAGDPLNPEFNRELGAAYFEARDLRNARRHLEKAASIDPADEMTVRLLEDVDAEERRTSFETAGVGASVAPWSPAPSVPVAQAAISRMPDADGMSSSTGVTATATGMAVIPPAGAASPGPRGRSVVLYVAPGGKGGPSLPDLPDTLLRGGRSSMQTGTTANPNPVFGGLANPIPPAVPISELVEPLKPEIATSAPEPVPLQAAPPASAVSPLPGPEVAAGAPMVPASAPVRPPAGSDGPANIELPVQPHPVKQTASAPAPSAPKPIVKAAPASRGEEPPKPVEPPKLQPSEDALADAEAMPAEGTAPVVASQPRSPGGITWSQRHARGVDAYLRGRWEEALPDFLACLKQREDPHIYEMVGLIFQRLGAPEDAYDASRRAAEMGRREPAFTARLGLMAAGLGKWGDGRRYLTEALTKLPHRVDLRLHLARCLRGVGDIDGARREVEIVLQDPVQSYAVKRRAEQELAAMGITPSSRPKPSSTASGTRDLKRSAVVERIRQAQIGKSAPVHPAKATGTVVLFAKPAPPAPARIASATPPEKPVLEPGAPSRW
ncbi:MAG TPA: tetratricopeptide repeat protein [Candidatus Ozemobacteraceae bacterium]